MKKISSVVCLFGLPLITSGCLPMAAFTTYEVGTTVAEERTVGDVVDDATILTKIKAQFANHDFSNLLTEIGVSVVEGRVLLTGSVADHKYSLQASELVWQVRGVKEVINEIEVADKDIKTRAKDSYISTQVRAKFLLDKDVRSVNYTVDTNNGVVFLVGIAQSEEELRKVTEIASQVRGVVKVVSHVTLKSDQRRTK
jgi:osmotically-inducible protein OsmY